MDLWLAKTGVVLLALNCASGQGCSDDWPQWGGNDLGRNMVSRAKNLPSTFTPKPSPGESENVRWKVRLGKFIYGNPTIAAGRILVGTDDSALSDDPRFHPTRGGMVQCLDEATGELLWKLAVPHRPESRLPEGAYYNQQPIGTCSSAAIVEGRAFLMTSACEIVCLDMNGQADGNDGPFQDEGRYMAGPGNPPIELGPEDADLIWVYDLVDELGVCPHDVASCSPLVDGRILYTVTSNGVNKPHEK